MAISAREQRLVPLEATGCWRPFGFLGIPPWLEEEILEDEPLWTLTRSRRRLHTWSGYCPHRLTQLAMARCNDRNEADACHQSVGSCTPQSEGQTIHLKLPEMSKHGSQESMGKGLTCIDFDSETATPSTSKSSCALSMSEVDDWGSPVHSLSHSGVRDEFKVTPSAHVEPACRTNGCGRREHAIQQTHAEVAALLQPSITTLKVQGISNTLTRRGLLDMLNGCGFANKYDFVLVPTACGSPKNLGFAIVNFASPETAGEFARRFPHSGATEIRDKRWHVAPAHIQGFLANAAVDGSGVVRRPPASVSRGKPTRDAVRTERAQLGKPVSQLTGLQHRQR